MSDNVIVVRVEESEVPAGETPKAQRTDTPVAEPARPLADSPHPKIHRPAESVKAEPAPKAAPSAPAATTPAPAPKAAASPSAPQPAAAAAAPEAAEAGGAEAAGAAAGAEGLAALAGPVGIAIVVAKVVADKLNKVVDGAIRAVGTTAERAGHVGTALAANDNRGAAEEVAGGMADLAGNIPLVGDKLKGIGESAIKVSKAFGDVTQAFVDRGRQLEMFSPQLATANARADIRSFMADAREAQALGPSLSRLIDTQSELSNDVRELLLPIKKAVVEGLATILEVLREFIGPVRQGAAAVGAVLDTLKQMIRAVASGDVQKLFALWRDLPEDIAKAIADAFKKKDLEMPLDAFLKMIERDKPKNQGENPGPNLNRGDLNIPLLR